MTRPVYRLVWKLRSSEDRLHSCGASRYIAAVRRSRKGDWIWMLHPSPEADAMAVGYVLREGGAGRAASREAARRDAAAAARDRIEYVF